MEQMVNYQLGSKVKNITILKDKRIPVSRNKLLQQWQNAAPSSPVVSGVRVTRSLVLNVFSVERCLSFCPVSFGRCVFCSSSTYGF
jgi:hypothetical protein